MKILWLSHLVPYPPKAGVIQRSYHLLRQLAAGHEVDLLAFHQPALMNPLVGDPGRGLDTALEHLGRFCRVQGVFPIPSDSSWHAKARLVARGAAGRSGYTMDWLRSRPYRQAVRGLVTRHRYGLLHCDTISLAACSQEAAGVPTVIDHHNVESHMMARRAGKEPNPFKRIYFSLEAGKLRRAERVWCTAAAHNITCSDTDSTRLREVAPGAAVSTIPNGVDTDHFAPRQSSGPPRRLLFVGTMNWYPNVQAVEYLIREVVPLLRVRHPELGLDIVGANAPAWLRERAAPHPQVLFHGFVDDIRPIMGDALAFVCPISDGGGTKLKVLNALAMGVPVIAHPIACEGIDVAHGESVLFTDSPGGFVDLITRVARDQDLRRGLGLGGRALVERRYSVDVIGRTLRHLYESLAGTDGSVPSSAS
jgi:glycosyltransferase involved in cell wall biosynthesis